MEAHEAKALQDIERFGCHIVHVFEEDGLPPFSYSVGIERSAGAPEVVVVGLKAELAGFIINEYRRRVREGASYAPGDRAAGFLTGFEIEFRGVHKANYPEHFGADLWLYAGDGFRVLQMVYPSTQGVWPWDEGVSAAFAARQLLLEHPLPGVES